jgi:hypothetical protein
LEEFVLREEVCLKVNLSLPEDSTLQETAFLQEN